MEGREFYERVNKSPKLEWLGIQEGAVQTGDVVLVCHVESGIKHALTVISLRAQPWKELEAVLTGKRSPKVMIHLTRIVGYYSRVQNWNRSKLAELHDRQKAAKFYMPPEGVLDGCRRSG